MWHPVQSLKFSINLINENLPDLNKISELIMVWHACHPSIQGTKAGGLGVWG
jgi:hypothetical protein